MGENLNSEFDGLSNLHDDAGMGEHLNGEVYGLSNLRRSRRIADRVEKIGQQWWGSNINASVHFVNNREESEEEEEVIEDDEPNGDFDVAGSDEDLEGYEDEDNDDLFAGPGQEGISHSGIVWGKVF